MEFKKYCSIEDIDFSNEIEKWLRMFPELKNEKYIIQEKIHGSNFSIWINKDGYKLANRTKFLEKGENFFGYEVLKPLFDKIFLKTKEILLSDKITEIVLFGELYGKKIQKGVYYSDKVKIAFFDIRINKELVPQNKFLEYSQLLELDTVPKLAIVDNIKEALNFNTKLNSKISDREFKEGENIIEGIVIKPYNKIYISNGGNTFFLKKKNIEYKEKKRAKKNNKIVLEETEELKKLATIFKDYLTENRVNSVISKLGEITSKNDIGKYLGYVINDAKEDFLKDYPKDYSKSESKYIFKKNNEIVKIIMNKIV